MVGLILNKVRNRISLGPDRVDDAVDSYLVRDFFQYHDFVSLRKRYKCHGEDEEWQLGESNKSVAGYHIVYSRSVFTEKSAGSCLNKVRRLFTNVV